MPPCRTARGAQDDPPKIPLPTVRAQKKHVYILTQDLRNNENNSTAALTALSRGEGQGAVVRHPNVRSHCSPLFAQVQSSAEIRGVLH